MLEVRALLPGATDIKWGVSKIAPAITMMTGGSSSMENGLFLKGEVHLKTGVFEGQRAQSSGFFQPPNALGARGLGANLLKAVERPQEPREARRASVECPGCALRP